MMNWDTRRLTGLIDAALGRKPLDLCVRNCRIVNVFTGSVEQLDIGISGGFISGWGRCEAVREIDAEGMYACPGFIDAHIRVESSLLSPPQFCAAVVPWGTSAVVSDPHEIANVLGLDGIRYLVETSRGLPLDMFFNLPSCVPATGLETCGAQLRAADLHSILPHDRILGLAEMMNFPGVLMGLPDVIDKLVLFNHRRMDGHAPLLQGAGLDAYLAAGISSDHECTTLDEAREKLEKGMFIMIREGSQSKDLETLLPAVDDHTWPRCMFISDDTHPDDLVLKGHMNAIVNKAMALGMNPVRALCLDTDSRQLFRPDPERSHRAWIPGRFFTQPDPQPVDSGPGVQRWSGSCGGRTPPGRFCFEACCLRPRQPHEYHPTFRRGPGGPRRAGNAPNHWHSGRLPAYQKDISQTQDRG